MTDTTQRLDDMTIAIIATNGFEQSELQAPLKSLREAGADVRILALDTAPIRGWQDGDWGAAVEVDQAIGDADATEFNALVLPGGVINPDTLRTNAAVIEFIRSMAAGEKPIAAVCHGPWLLIEAGLVKGRKVTSWPSVRTDLENAGGKWEDAEVVRDGFLITSRKPDDLPAFCEALIEAVASRSSARVG